MYSDILSSASYGRFNRKLANLTSLTCAVYWSEILDIASKVVKKNKFDGDGFFVLNREYVREQTNIPTELQEQCDAVLSRLGVLDVDKADSNKIRIRLETMAAILIDDNKKDLKSIAITAKVTREDKKESKRVGIIHRLQDGVVEADEDLLNAYKQWIEVLYDKGVCRKPQVDLFINSVRNYSSDKAVQLEIIQISTKLSYRDATWAISRYKQAHPTSLGPQKIVKEVDKSITF